MRNNISRCYLAVFLKNLQFFGAVAVPYFLDWLKVDYTRMFLLQAWFLFWVFVLEIPTGVVADKFGRKTSVAAGCILLAADMFFFSLTRSYYLLFVAEFLGAVGMTLMSGADQALLYDSLVQLDRQDRARVFFSRYEAAGTLGLLVSFPAGSLLAARGGYPGTLPVTFSLTAVSSLLAAIAISTTSEPPRSKPREGFIRMGIDGLRTLFATPSLRAYVMNAVTISAVTFFAFWFYQPISQRAGLSVAYLGFVGAGFNLFSTVLLANVSLLERTLGIEKLLLGSALVPALLFAALGSFHRLEFALPALFLLVGCKMVRMPILNDFINRHVESGNRATVISSVSLLERFVTFALYPIVGWLADVSLDRTMWLLGAICGVFAIGTRITRRHLPAEEVRK